MIIHTILEAIHFVLLQYIYLIELLPSSEKVAVEVCLGQRWILDESHQEPVLSRLELVDELLGDSARDSHHYVIPIRKIPPEGYVPTGTE